MDGRTPPFLANALEPDAAADIETLSEVGVLVALRGHDRGLWKTKDAIALPPADCTAAWLTILEHTLCTVESVVFEYCY